MSGITFLSENYADTSNLSMTTGSENAQFPLDNLKIDAPSIIFRGVGSISVIVIDLLATRDIDFIAIAADPINSFAISNASIKTSASTDFSMSTSYDIELSIDQAIGYVEITEVSHRYAELTLTGSGNYTELGKLFIGKAINIPLNSLSIDSFKYGYMDRSVIKTNKYGQKFIDQINQTKLLAGSLQYCTREEQKELDDMLIRHGQTLPLWMIVDKDSEAMEEGNFKLTIYGYNENELEWSADGGQLFSTSIDIRQAI